MMYRPKNADEFRTPVKLLIPNGSAKYNGVNRPTYPDDGDVIFVNWKAYGGTETTVNGVWSILDTAVITTWYRPDITADCRLLCEDGAVYEIKSKPENIEMQNVYSTFKVERVKGGG
jgi:hypothetical protein